MSAPTEAALAAALLHAARDAIEAAVRGRSPREAPEEHEGALRELGAAFVTLRTLEGDLRGCIGELEARRPLAESVRSCAVGAALRDPRFGPVTAEELDHLRIGVSVLTRPQPIDPTSVEVGRHGLLIERGDRRGVLLPEVPIEQGWDAETFLGYTCRKAGLPADAWRDPETHVYAFESRKYAET
jgi:AmmeMemoRadiSam system protein A